MAFCCRASAVAWRPSATWRAIIAWAHTMQSPETTRAGKDDAATAKSATPIPMSSPWTPNNRRASRQSQRIPATGLAARPPSPISVKHHPSFPVIPAAEMKVPPKLNNKPYPMAATNVPATAMPTTPDRGNEPFAQGDATRSRSHRWRRGSLMAPTQTKATAEHPASTRKHAANPAAFTSPNATRGPRRSEAEVVRRYRPSQRPRAWGGAASETVAVADDQKEAPKASARTRHTAGTERPRAQTMQGPPA